MKFSEEKLERAFVELLGNENYPHFHGTSIARAADEVLIEADLQHYLLTKYKSKRGVTGFVGTNPSERPRPITTDEAKNLLQKAGEIKGEKTVRVKQTFEVGDQVKITDGPFATFSGSVEEVNAEKNKLRVMVQIFGRATRSEEH